MVGGTYYHVECELIIQNTGTVNDVVIFGEQGVDVKTGTTLVNEVVVGANFVQLRGGVTLNAALPLPAIISGGGGVQADANVTVFGAIYTEGEADFNPINLHGPLISLGGVEIQGGSGTLYTDDHTTDPNYLRYYAIMPGFTYPAEQLTGVIQPGSWRELQ